MTGPRCTCRPGALLMCNGCRTRYHRQLTARTRPTLIERIGRWLTGASFEELHDAGFAVVPRELPDGLGA